MSDSASSKVRIFVSYAHADEALKKELDKYLKVLRRSGKIAVWQDRELVAGDEWDATILRELALANVILLLVSVDFNASDFIWDKELAAAMQRHEAGTARVVPVILRPCQWSSLPYAKLQALPRNARPVTDHPDRDAVFTEIANEIERLVDRMNQPA
jgi:hypothetical protein